MTVNRAERGMNNINVVSKNKMQQRQLLSSKQNIFIVIASYSFGLSLSYIHFPILVKKV